MPGIFQHPAKNLSEAVNPESESVYTLFRRVF